MFLEKWALAAFMQYPGAPHPRKDRCLPAPLACYYLAVAPLLRMGQAGGGLRFAAFECLGAGGPFVTVRYFTPPTLTRTPATGPVTTVRAGVSL